MKHIVKTWFTDKTLYDYFNSDFKRNKIGTLGFPRSIIKSFTRNSTTIDQATIDKITDSLGQSVIDAIVKRHFILKSFDFKYLIEEHQEYLREAVCYEIQEVIFNKKTMERSGGASISTPSFSIGVDSTNWLFTYDEMSIRTKELVALADLPNYKIVGDGFIGRISHETPKGTIVIYQWNNVELGKELSIKGNEGQPYANFQAMLLAVEAMITAGLINDVDKYDYAYITTNGEKALWRFEGGNWKVQDYWDRKDIRQIEGNRYLVYKNYMLVCSDLAGSGSGSGIDYTGAKNGDLFAYSATLGKGVWIDPPSATGGTNIKFKSTYGSIDFSDFGKWYIVQNMEGQLGFGQNEPGLVYVLDGNSIWGFPTTRTAGGGGEANDFSIVRRVGDFSFNVPTAAGALAYSEHFGDLDDQSQRDNFMAHAKIGYWYTFTIQGTPYQVVITSGDKTTNWLWTGKRIIDGLLGKTTELISGSTSSLANSVGVGSFTGDAFSPTIALPGAYGDTQYIPKATVEQMIIDAANSIVTDDNDPTWADVGGSQSTLFNPSQITITMTGSGLVQGDYVQFLLGSNAGNMVLDGAVQIYDDAATAARNGNVAGQYKWYAYKQSSNVLIFVMEDSKGALQDNAQAIFKIRKVSPDVQEFTAHYTSQAAILKGAVWIGEVATGASKEITLPAGLTIYTLTGVGVTVGDATDWYKIDGWDKVTPMYMSVTSENTNNIWWVELKVEAIPGQITKIKVTNFKSGNLNTEGSNYSAHWISFKGGR